MEIKWVKDSVVDRIKAGKKANSGASALFKDMLVELRKRPNSWAEFPVKLAHATTARQWLEKHKNVEIKVTGGNGLPKADPNKKDWTVYVRVVSASDKPKRAYNKTGKYSKKVTK